VYKWKHSRRVIGEVLSEEYAKLYASGGVVGGGVCPGLSRAKPSIGNNKDHHHCYYYYCYYYYYPTGWRMTRGEIQRDVKRLLGGAYEEFMAK